MLVLTRKKGQSIIIDGNIRVVLVDISGETVRLGIEAPPDVDIFRSEIYQALMKENKEAATVAEDIIEQIKKKNSDPFKK